MWEYNLWGFCFFPRQSHALHDSWLEGWKTDMMGLMLAFQFTLPFSITQGQNFPSFPYNLAQHLSSIHQNQL
jgi:hypothetical protein